MILSRYENKTTHVSSSIYPQWKQSIWFIWDIRLIRDLFFVICLSVGGIRSWNILHAPIVLWLQHILALYQRAKHLHCFKAYAFHFNLHLAPTFCNVTCGTVNERHMQYALDSEKHLTLCCNWFTSPAGYMRNINIGAVYPSLTLFTNTLLIPSLLSTSCPSSITSFKSPKQKTCQNIVPAVSWYCVSTLIGTKLCDVKDLSGHSSKNEFLLSLNFWKLQ